MRRAQRTGDVRGLLEVGIIEPTESRYPLSEVVVPSDHDTVYDISGTMGLDDLEGFLRQKGAPELVTEIGTGTATFNALVDAVAVSPSTVSSRLSEGVERDIFTVSHRPTEHGTEKRYKLTLLGRRIYDWADKTEFERKVRELRRLRHERDTSFEQLIGKLNRDLEIRKMVADSEPLEGEDVDLPEGASLVPKAPSEEARREAKFERMEESLEPVADDQAEGE